MLKKLNTKIKNLILDAVITRIIDYKTVQASFLGVSKELESINQYGFKSIAPNGSNLIIFASKGRLDNAKAFSISDAEEIVKASGAVAGESIIYNEVSESYIILKNNGDTNIVSAGNVNINGNSEPLVRGTALKTLFNLHTHTETGVTTSVPNQPMSATQLSTKNKTE